MPDIPVSTFFNFFVYLSIPFVFAAAAKYFRLPSVIGYMIGGVILGNFFGNLISREVINQFAYFGIILLLFTVGLEVNFDRMINLKKFIIIGGFLQVAVTIFFGFLLSLLFKFNLLQSFLIGIAISSSSTTLVAKLIEDRGEEGSFLGELVLGILMFQDLAFIPFIIIFNSLTLKTIAPLDVIKNITIDILIASIILTTVYYLGRRIIPEIFNRVAKLSREILNFFIIIFIFLTAFLSAVFKIPILVGTFISGVLVSQTLEHHHIFTRIRPLRDLLATIFFIYIGSNVELVRVLPSILQIGIFSISAMFLKALIIFFVFIFLKFSTRMAFYSSLSLFQINEESFILMSIALSNKIFSHEQYVFVLSAILLGLITTPVAISTKDKIYLIIRKFIEKYLPPLEQLLKNKIDMRVSPIEGLEMKDHVVICGYGRVGSMVGRALQLANILFIAVDYNFHTVEKAKREGINIIYGDPTDIDVLDFVQAADALVLVAAVPSKFDQEAIIINARKLNPELFIIGRVQSDRDHQRLKDLGARTVVQPELEASVSIIKKIFLLKNKSKEEIVKSLRHLKLIHGAI